MTRKQLLTETILLSISIVFIILGFIFSQGDPEPWYVALFFGLSFEIGGYEKDKEGIRATINKKPVYLN